MSGAVADLVRVVFTRRNALTVAVMVCLALVGVVIPDRTLSYAAYLSLFSVWMIGFVLTVVDLLRLRSGTLSTD
jgi:energy-converting hydrogenase Eha subunit H